MKFMSISRTLRSVFSLIGLLMLSNVNGQINQANPSFNQSIDNDKDVFRDVEQMPRFPGCEKITLIEEEIRNCSSNKLSDFIYSNIAYPIAAKENRVEGTVIIQFIVDESGKVIDGKVVRDINGYFENTILNMFDTMPNWSPGLQEGEAVSVAYTFPVIFKLPKEENSEDGGMSVFETPVNIVEEEIYKEFASDFEMEMEDGSKKKLSDFRGQVVYLSFWASWCGPCIKGFNTYRKLREDIEDLGVVMLNISIDEDPAKWKESIKKNQPTGIHAIVRHDEVRELYQLYNVPRYEIIGKSGQFLYLSDEEGRDVIGDFKRFSLSTN